MKIQVVRSARFAVTSDGSVDTIADTFKMINALVLKDSPDGAIYTDLKEIEALPNTTKSSIQLHVNVTLKNYDLDVLSLKEDVYDAIVKDTEGVAYTMPFINLQLENCEITTFVANKTIYSLKVSNSTICEMVRQDCHTKTTIADSSVGVSSQRFYITKDDTDENSMAAVEIVGKAAGSEEDREIEMVIGEDGTTYKVGIVKPTHLNSCLFRVINSRVVFKNTLLGVFRRSKENEEFSEVVNFGKKFRIPGEYFDVQGTSGIKLKVNNTLKKDNGRESISDAPVNAW